MEKFVELLIMSVVVFLGLTLFQGTKYQIAQYGTNRAMVIDTTTGEVWASEEIGNGAFKRIYWSKANALF